MPGPARLPAFQFRCRIPALVTYGCRIDQPARSSYTARWPGSPLRRFRWWPGTRNVPRHGDAAVTPPLTPSLSVQRIRPEGGSDARDRYRTGTARDAGLLRTGLTRRIRPGRHMVRTAGEVAGRSQTRRPLGAQRDGSGNGRPGRHPSSRTVLCKGIDERGVVFYTNYTSSKSHELRATRFASATFPWFGMQRQAHVRGTVEKVSQAETAAYWASRPRGSQLGAWASPQSRTVQSRQTLEVALANVERQFADAERAGAAALGWLADPAADGRVLAGAAGPHARPVGVRNAWRGVEAPAAGSVAGRYTPKGRHVPAGRVDLSRVGLMAGRGSGMSTVRWSTARTSRPTTRISTTHHPPARIPTTQRSTHPKRGRVRSHPSRVDP